MAVLRGNRQLLAQITAAADSGRVCHAYLLEGIPGSGRKTVAMHMARAFLCMADGGRPCGECLACRKVSKGIHPDVQVLLPEKDKKTISVDQVRQLREKAFVVPNEGRHRVTVIPDAQQMTVQAQNALLKLLEEPPSFSVFILTAQARSQLLETICSRLVCLETEKLPAEEVMAELKQRFAGKSEADLALAARLGEGSVGGASAFLQGGTASQLMKFCADFLRAAGEGTASLMKLAPDLLAMNKEKDDLSVRLKALRLAARDVLVAQVGASHMLLFENAQQALEAGRGLTKTQVGSIMEAVDVACSALNNSLNFRITVMNLLIRCQKTTQTQRKG